MMILMIRNVYMSDRSLHFVSKNYCLDNFVTLCELSFAYVWNCVLRNEKAKILKIIYNRAKYFKKLIKFLQAGR